MTNILLFAILMQVCISNQSKDEITAKKSLLWEGIYILIAVIAIIVQLIQKIGGK